jgi:adenine-specific DNA methylase
MIMMKAIKFVKKIMKKEEFFCDIISDGDSIISKVIFQTNKNDSIELEFEYFEQIFSRRFIW